MPLSFGTRLGHYDVTSLLGEGGMDQVALKILPDAFAADPDRLAFGAFASRYQGARS